VFFLEIIDRGRCPNESPPILDGIDGGASIGGFSVSSRNGTWHQ
jgi:hypothetical protein